MRYLKSAVKTPQISSARWHDIERGDGFPSPRGKCLSPPLRQPTILVPSGCVVVPARKATVLIRGKEAAYLLQCSNIFLAGGARDLSAMRVQADAGCLQSSPSQASR